MNNKTTIGAVGAVLLGGAYLLGGVGDPVTAETIQKIDTTSFKIVEQVETTYTLTDLEKEVGSLLTRKQIKQIQIEKAQTEISEIDTKVAKLQAQIAEAKKQGVK